MKITIPGIPLPKARHRFSKRGGYLHTYDPQESAKMTVKNEIRAIVETQYQLIHKSSSVDISFDFFFPFPYRYTPNSWLIKSHITKPDLSNLIKFYEDCLNGIAFHDDSQINSISSTKQYSQNPRTEIFIMENKCPKIHPNVEKVLNSFSVDDAKEMASMAKELFEDLAAFTSTHSTPLWAEATALHIQKIAKLFTKKLAKISKIPDIPLTQHGQVAQHSSCPSVVNPYADDTQ